jgi:hypothetical protein
MVPAVFDQAISLFEALFLSAVGADDFQIFVTMCLIPQPANGTGTTLAMESP